MSYLDAIEHASKNKERVPDTPGVIDTLWRDRKALLVNGYNETYEALFSRIEDHIDILLSQDQEPIGFITLKLVRDGTYSIVNNSKINPHPTITITPGHGLAIKEDFRKRGLGSALLSLAIGIAQRDHKEKESTAKFEVLATDITESGYGCYNNFGFQIMEGMKVTEGRYTDRDQVPEIKILRTKASFWVRFKKRLGI